MRGPTLRLVCVNDVYILDNLPRLRTLVRHHREAAPADVMLTMLAGDFVAPSLLSSLDHGAAMVACLNAVPISHVCYGTHEQDVHPDALSARAREFQGTWLNTNVPGFEPELPAAEAIEVRAEGGRALRVGLVGVVTEDATLYRPGAFGGRILPANAAALEVGRGLMQGGGCACVIALTHQSLERDQSLALAQGDPPIPVIVGGHEHVPHVENMGSAWIVKAGTDAVYAVVVDLEWTADEPPAGVPDLPRVSVRIEPVAAYDEDESMRALTDARMRPLKELHAATLLRLAPGETLSSEGTRVRQTSLGAMFASRVRDTLGVDACLLNGGGIRAGRSYEGALTYGDLEAELPFANEVVVVSMPGSVVRDAVAASRARAPVAAPGFLQVDDAMAVDARNDVTAVAGAPIDPSREYRVATVRVLFDGMDGIEPLLRFARERPERVPPRDSGRELTVILVEAFSLALWRSVGRFEDVDADHDQQVTADELRAAIARATSEEPVAVLVEGILRALDTDHDGRISREEAARASREARPGIADEK